LEWNTGRSEVNCSNHNLQRHNGTIVPRDGLINEDDEIAGEIADKDVLDTSIVRSAQAVEHYEIAHYGTLIAWAKSLGHDDIIRLLNTNLNEDADKKLSTVALRKEPQGRELIRSEPPFPHDEDRR
jgi:ferritin-like metal-binding protein YciE